jgi:hypothetical protein
MGERDTYGSQAHPIRSSLQSDPFFVLTLGLVDRTSRALSSGRGLAFTDGALLVLYADKPCPTVGLSTARAAIRSGHNRPQPSLC